MTEGGRGREEERERGQNWTSIELTSLRSRPFHSGSFLGSAHDSCHISSFRNVFETRWRNLKGLKLRLWFFFTYHGNFPEAIHLGEISHTQKVTSMWATAICPLMGKTAPILCFHSRAQHLCKFIGITESVYIRKEFNSHRAGLGHKHGRRFIVLGHKYGRHDVM